MVIKPVPSDDASRLSWIDASSGEPFMVFSNGKNPVAGMEFLGCLLSKESAKWFAQNVGSIMPVVGGAEGVDLSSAMTSALAAVDNAGPNILDRPSFPGWYSDIYSEVKDSMGRYRLDVQVQRNLSSEFRVLLTKCVKMKTLLSLISLVLWLNLLLLFMVDLMVLIF